MAEWQDQLNTILSDPEAMAQIAALAQSISGGAGNSGGAEPPQNTAPQSSAPQSEAPRNETARDGAPPPNGAALDPAALQAMLGGLDPELMSRLVPLMREMNRPESSQATALLQALRPFLSEKRRDKVERAAQLARLIHLGKTFFTSQGQEAGHV